MKGRYKSMKKRFVTLLLATVLSSSMCMTAFAGNWEQTGTEWKYVDNGTYMTGWQWIDGKSYYFDGNGIMAKNTVIDGYELNADGQWIVNGIVQTQNTTTTPTSQQIIDYLSNDKINGYVRLEIDYSKNAVASGSTNIKHKNSTYKNGWAWIIYNKYSSQDYFVCALAFDKNGYLLVNTTTPDGYTTNEYGMLVINGQPVTHSARCKMFSWSSELYNYSGQLITDKNNVDLNTVDVLSKQMSISNYLDIVPFGKLVYNHCCYQDATGSWPYANGFGNCVEAQKALYPLARQ